MRWAKVREKAKKYAPLIALLYFFFLLNGERHENHVLQSELAQLDHHLEMEFTSTKDFLAGNLSSPDYHDSMIWEAEQLRTIASCGYYFQSSGFGADDAWLEVFSELSQFVQSPESFQQLTPQERETLAAFLNDYSYQNDPVLEPGTRRRSWTVWPGRWSGRTERRPLCPAPPPCSRSRRASKPDPAGRPGHPLRSPHLRQAQGEELIKAARRSISSLILRPRARSF